MRKSNADVLAGKIAFTARSSCMPAGVPGFSSFIVEPVFFMQSPKEILMVYSGDQQVAARMDECAAQPKSETILVRRIGWPL